MRTQTPTPTFLLSGAGVDDGVALDLVSAEVPRLPLVDLGEVADVKLERRTGSTARGVRIVADNWSVSAASIGTHSIGS